MKIPIIIASTCLIVSNTVHSADDQSNQGGVYRISKNYCPSEQPTYAYSGGKIPKCKGPRPQPIQRDYSITEQLLKDEIRSCGITEIRERIQEARRRTNAQEERRAFMLISFIAFNRTFYATSTDPLSRSIFDRASKDNAQVWTMPRHIDNKTFYRVLDETRQTIECTTSIDDEAFIEKVIADVQQNG